VNRFPNLMMFGAGLLSAIGFAPLGWWPVTLTCLALLIRCVAMAPNMRAALARGYMFGVGHFIVGLNWIAGAFVYQDTMPVWLGWVAVVALAIYIAVYPALAAGIAWFGRSNHKSFVIMFSGAWIVTEWLRATMFTGFAWNPLGVIWLPLIGVPRAITPWLGTYGLGGFTVLVVGTLAYVVPRWLDRVRALARAGKTEWLSLLIGPVVLGAVIVFGAFSMKYVARPEPNAARQPMIRIVQPNIGQQDKHEPAYERVNFAKLVSLTGKPGPVPRLILWPEAAIPDFLEEEEWARERLAALIGPRDVIMTGGVALIYNDDDKLIGARNAMFTLTPDAKIIARYDKAHLVPYGEYLPMKPILSLIGLTRLVPGTVDFIPGPGAQSLTVPGFGKVGIQICYEIIFSGDVVDSANRPDFLFNPSNDAWFGAWGPPQHLAQARLRAIEEGISVVRATPTGISAIIDPNGRIRNALPYQKPGFIEARMPRSYAPTLFAQYGNVLPLSLALLLIALGIALRAKRR
jgi:apolipoprotein N-acyltransferase